MPRPPARARLLLHEVESDIVIVGIDAISLTELDSWPWPRRNHAGVIERMATAAPKRVFIDVDFSSPSNDVDDGRLESALASWPGEPVILPAFLQQASGADTGAVLREPLPRFARHAELAAVNQVLDTDGLVRSFRAAWREGTYELPSVVALLTASTRSEADVPIDYSIALSSFGYVSYGDLLAGRVDPNALRAKTVFVGATAIELGDILAAPVHRALSGVVVQALALQTVRQGVRAPLPDWVQLAVPALLALLMAALCRAGDWRRSLAGLGGLLAAVCGAFVLLHATHGPSLELAPSALVVVLIFLAGTVRSLDEQTLRALALALGLRRRDALLRGIVDSSVDAILCVDARGAIQIANPAAARLFDLDPQSLVGTSFGELFPALRGQPLAVLPPAAVETEGLTRTGGALPIELTASRVLIADEELYTVIARDVSERQAHQRELEYRATHDALTTLPNRSALLAYMEQVLRGCTEASPAALLMLDLSRFKEVNDTLGHDTGDEVLQEVARRFRSLIGDRGLLARIGGDEFTAMLPDCDAVAAAGVARSLADALCAPVEAQGVAIDMGVNIGIARAPQVARDSWMLLQRADVAMYVAKRGLVQVEFYDESRDAHSVRRLAMMAKLRAAIGTPALQLKYQPKVNLRTRRVESVEALLRWDDPVQGAIGPAEFMPLAESTDLVRPLTEWTIAEALRQATRWRNEGLPLRIAVNLSASCCRTPGFPRGCAACSRLPRNCRARSSSRSRRAR